MNNDQITKLDERKSVLAKEITVAASVSEYGISPKELRGVMDFGSGLPEVLRPVERALSHIAQRLGVDLHQETPGLERSFAVAMQRRSEQKSVIPLQGSGLSLG